MNKVTSFNRITKNPQGLIGRYPGAKRRHLIKFNQILEAYRYSIVIEPFAGASWVSQAVNQSYKDGVSLCLADIDPTIRMLHEIWGDETLENELIKAHRNLQHYPVSELIDDLKLCYEEAYENNEAELIDVASMLLLRQLSYSGKLPPCAKNEFKLNYSFSKNQLKRWGNLTYSFPKAPKNKVIYEDWSDIIYKNVGFSISIIDPPYSGEIGEIKRRDNRYLNPSYFNHRPHDTKTFNLATNPVYEALSSGVTVVIACNYWGQTLSDIYRKFAENFGYVVFEEKSDIPMMIDNPTGSKNLYEDTYWVFCDPRSHLCRKLSNCANLAQLTPSRSIDLFPLGTN